MTQFLALALEDGTTALVTETNTRHIELEESNPEETPTLRQQSRNHGINRVPRENPANRF